MSESLDPVLAKLNLIVKPNSPERTVSLWRTSETGTIVSPYAGTAPAGSATAISGLESELVFGEFQGPRRISVIDDTSPLFSFLGILSPKDSGLMIIPSNHFVQRLINYSRSTFVGAFEKCRALLFSLDLSDEASKIIMKERIQDIFDIFRDVSDILFRELFLEHQDNPDVFGFLLGEVLVDADLDAHQKVSIISTCMNNGRAGIRYEAVRALDMLNSSVAQNVLQTLRSRESNREVRALIDASLRR